MKQQQSVSVTVSRARRELGPLATTLVVSIALAASACSVSPEGTASAAPSPAAAAPVTPVAALAQAGSGPAELIARGEHLVLTSGCHDCHTPLKMGANGPAPDMTRMLSGHPDTLTLPPAPKAAGPWSVAASATNTAWSGPWGTSYTANLTPDRETGLGAWTAQTFAAALKTGRHEGRGREILPPMPIAAYENFSADELEAIFAYLQSIPAVHNRVPQPLPPG